MAVLSAYNLLAVTLCLSEAFVMPHGCLKRPPSTLQVSISEDVTSISMDEGTARQVRPLHQNWWPVSALSALETDRPNGLEVLGQKLVTFYADEAWHVLDDRCSHRFAPLSEGRVEQRDGQACLQCAYHGWEFAANGTCVRVPQDNRKVDKARAVGSYATRTAAGLLWVWMDPGSRELGDSIRLPIDPLLEQFHAKFGDLSCFQRDLPYGMEILGENLIDLSHLPYAHHSLGQLKRSLGEDLPTRVMSEQERVDYAQWEREYKPNADPVLPTFQAEIVDAAEHDPILKPFAARQDPETTKDWRTTISYFDPAHVRYRRTQGQDGSVSHVELFICPRSQSRARVFLYNVFGVLLDSPNKDKPEKGLAKLKSKLQLAMFSRIFSPSRPAGHMIAHTIFDGDGIFLHKQGNRMKEAGLTFRDYSTPSSADVLLNAYRRFLDRAAKATRAAGFHRVADAVVGDGAYGDDAPRAAMLDRYQTHTVHCPTCRTALAQTRQSKALVQVMRTALVGAAGTYSVALLVVLLVSSLRKAVPSVVPALGAVAVTTWLATTLAGKRIQQLDTQINKFLFEDYIHAEKN